MNEGDKNALLHILRNPYNWSAETVQDTRLKAAEELERLWNIETQVSRQVKQLGHWFK